MTQRAVLVPVFLLPSVMLIVLFAKNFFNFNYQLEEEAGPAEEQPASNKADAYTIGKGARAIAPFSFTIGKPHG